jgi:hypothetical protein
MTEGKTNKYKENQKDVLKNEEQKLHIERIERANIPPDDKVLMVLLILDRKKVAMLDDYIKIDGTSEEKKKLKRKIEKTFSEYTDLADDLNIFYDTIVGLNDYKVSTNKTMGFQFHMSKKIDCLQMMRTATLGEKRDELTRGILLGYPKTAAEAFENKETIKGALPFDEEKLEEEGMAPFLGFAMSKENWQEELEWAKENMRIIKEYSPKILAEAIRYDKHLKELASH